MKYFWEWFTFVCIVFLWMELRPSIERTENGDILLFVTWEGKREFIILWYGKV